MVAIVHHLNGKGQPVCGGKTPPARALEADDEDCPLCAMLMRELRNMRHGRRWGS